MLIGANVPEALQHDECHKGKRGEPYAVRTLLEWAVLGPVDAVSFLDSHRANENFVKYGSQLLLARL